MDIQEILAALQAIIDAAGDEPLSDEDAARYEALETKLRIVQRHDQIWMRHQSYGAVPQAALHVTAAAVDDTLDRAFDSYMRTGRPNADLMELRAQETGTNSEGGYLVPDSFRDKLVERMKASGGVLNDVETISTSDGRPLSWPTVDDTANLGEIVAQEAAPAGGADLVFGESTLGAFKYEAVGAGALPLRVSWELLQDSAFDIQALVSRFFGQRIARKMGRDAVNGTGSGQPLGLVYGKVPVEPATVSGHSYADLLEIIHSVDPAYRANAKWYFNDGSLLHFESMVDTHGDPLWRPITGTIGDDPSNGRLLGYPVVIDQAFNDYNPVDDDLNSGAFGDIREGYLWRQVKDVTVIVDPYTRALNGQTTFQAWARADGTVQNPNAYVAFSGYEAS